MILVHVDQAAYLSDLLFYLQCLCVLEMNVCRWVTVGNGELHISSSKAFVYFIVAFL